MFYKKCNLLLQKALQISVKSKYLFTNRTAVRHVWVWYKFVIMGPCSQTRIKISLFRNHVHKAITSLSLSSCMFIYYCCCSYCLFCLTNYHIQIHSADFPLKWRNEAQVVHDTWVMCGDDCLHGWRFGYVDLERRLRRIWRHGGVGITEWSARVIHLTSWTHT